MLQTITDEVLTLLQDVEVPETLLKKRKQNEKAREERLAAAVAARKVCRHSDISPSPHFLFSYDAFNNSWLV